MMECSKINGLIMNSPREFLPLRLVGSKFHWHTSPTVPGRQYNRNYIAVMPTARIKHSNHNFAVVVKLLGSIGNSMASEKENKPVISAIITDRR